MLYATQYHRTLLVVAADSLLEFEDFALTPHVILTDETSTVERADILDMLGNPIFNGYTIAPVVVECVMEEDVEAITQMGITLLTPLAAVDKQAEMIERAKLEAEADLPPDRRTLAEVHGLTEHDPWDNSNEKQKEAGRKQDEQMKAIREAGGLTGDSFAGKVGDKLNINSGTIYHDEDGAVIGADIKASKSTIKPYELTIDGDEQVDFDELFDELKIPENRVLEQDGNKVTLLLHDFQTGEVAEALDRRKLSYTLSKVIEETVAENDFAVEGHEEYQIFYSVQIDQATIHEIVPALEAKGFDTSLATTMRNVGRGCWLAFIRETTADECAKICHEIGHACAVVAINRKGQSILGEGTDARVIDTNQHVEIGPRPWNARAAEIDAMTDEEKAELRKSVQASEYLIAIDEHPELRTVVYIVPESYFRETGELWTGEMILDMIPKEADAKILTQLQPGIYRGGLEAQLLKDNMCRWGFVESLLLRIHINDLLSEQRSAK